MLWHSKNLLIVRPIVLGTLLFIYVESGEFRRLRYKYCAVGEKADRANMDAMTAAITLRTLTRRLAKIIPKKNRVAEFEIPQKDTLPHELPAALME